MATGYASSHVISGKATSTAYQVYLVPLVAPPPPPAGALPPPTGGLTKLKMLNLSYTQITDAGCAALAAALESGALPALKELYLAEIPASAAARAAVYEARADLYGGEESESDEHEESGSGSDQDEEGEGDSEDGEGDD